MEPYCSSMPNTWSDISSYYPKAKSLLINLHNSIKYSFSLSISFYPWLKDYKTQIIKHINTSDAVSDNELPKQGAITTYSTTCTKVRYLHVSNMKFRLVPSLYTKTVVNIICSVSRMLVEIASLALLICKRSEKLTVTQSNKRFNIDLSW